MSLLKPKCHENSKEKLNYDKIKTFMKNISQNFYKYKKLLFTFAFVGVLCCQLNLLLCHTN